MNCEVCNEPIPQERLEAVPGTTTCVKHSKVKAIVGFMIPTASKGCASTLVTLDPDNDEQMRQAKRAHLRGR